MDQQAAMSGPSAPLTRKLCRDTWGADLENLTRYAQLKLKKCGGWTVHKKFQPYTPEVKFELGMVTYKRSGKYGAEDRVVPWYALPEDDEDEARDEYLAVPSELRRPQGWWPVVRVFFPSDCSMRTVHASGGYVIVICIYQLMWDQPVGWSVQVFPLRG
jgi:hypothetical protein